MSRQAAPDGPAAAAAAEALRAEAGKAVPTLRRLGKGRLAELAERTLTSGEMPRVVVIGETRRGKTTLINALVDNPDLDPLTALDLPATFVEVIPRAGDQAPARPLVVVPGQTPGGDRISLAELGELAADEDAHLPLGIRVVVAGELGPVILVDTPGIGDADTNRAELSRRLAWETGGALIYVVDAGSPLAAPELAHLQACAEAVEHLVVAVTMTDKYPHSAAELADHIRSQLGTDPRLRQVPVMPVSATLARAAAALPESEQRDRLLAGTGLPALRGWVRGVGAHAATVRHGKALRLCRAGVAEELAELTRREQVLRSPESSLALREERTRLVAARRAAVEQREQLQLIMDLQLNRLRDDLAELIDDRMFALDHEGRRQIDRMPLVYRRRQHLAAVNAELNARFQLLKAQIDHELETRLTGLVLQLHGEQPAVQTVPVNRRSAGPQFQLDREAHERRTDANLLIEVVRSGLMTARVSSRVDPVVGFAVGAGLHLMMKGQLVDRQQAMIALREEVARHRSGLNRHIKRTIDELKPALVTGFRRRFRDLEEAVQAEIVLVDQQMRQSGNERNQELQQLQTRAAGLRGVLQSMDRTFAQAPTMLTADPGPPGTSGPSGDSNPGTTHGRDVTRAAGTTRNPGTTDPARQRARQAVENGAGTGDGGSSASAAPGRPAASRPDQEGSTRP